MEEATAVEKFVLNSTIPLIYNREDIPVLMGTGCLFNRLFRRICG